MTKIFITNDSEWYPVYGFHLIDNDKPTYYNEIDVPLEIIERWRSAFDTFNAVQRELSDHHREAKRIADLPVEWWTITIRRETNWIRYGFIGKDFEARAHMMAMIKEYNTIVQLKLASDSEELMYQVELDRERLLNQHA